MINNEKEIWKKHPDITGIEVSTLGNVRTLDRLGSNGRGTYPVEGRVLNPFDNGKGYLQVNVSINGKQAKKRVNRLVAQTFLPNPNGFPMVNHKDCNTQNNNVKNLEWCDNSYNMQYREKFGIPQAESQGHPLFAINLSTMEVSHFRAQGEASRLLGVSKGNINGVIKGRLKQTGGYWFVNDDGNSVDVVKSKLHDVGGTGLKIYS